MARRDGLKKVERQGVSAAQTASGIRAPLRKSSSVRRWRVVLLRNKGEILGAVEASDAQAAKAAAAVQFELDHVQRKAPRAVNVLPLRRRVTAQRVERVAQEWGLRLSLARVVGLLLARARVPNVPLKVTLGCPLALGACWI